MDALIALCVQRTWLVVCGRKNLTCDRYV